MAENEDPFNDRGPVVFAVTTATLVAAVIFVAARLASRFLVRKFSWDDSFIVAAVLLAFGLSFSIDYATAVGLGKADRDIDPGWIPSLRMCEYVFSVLYNPALMTTKTSILIFYLRLSRNTKPKLRIASYVTLAVVNVAGVVLTFLNIFQCNPVGAVFSTASDPGAKCIPLVTLYLVSAPVNIITDLAILILPIPVLTGMRLPQKQKSILVGTFTLGIFVTVVDVIRIYYLQEASFQQESKTLPSSTSRLGDSTNFAWTASLSLMWSAVEVNVGIICACIPTCKPIVSKLMPKWIDHARSLNRSGNHTVDTGIERQSPMRLGSDAPPEPKIQPMPPLAGPDAEGEGEGEGDGGAEMGMLDFLTTPDTDPSAVHRTATTMTSTTDNTVYFGFVNMRRPKSMMKTRGRESFKYCTIVTILFFLWGFSYGLLNSLNGEIGKIIGTTDAMDLGLQCSYFGAYLLGPLLVGGPVLKSGGFKATFITGLSIYGIGIIMFWPSAVLASYAGFVVSNFVVAFGLSILETGANPFLALCGAPRYMEARLLTAQAIQAVASVISPLLAEKALFTTIEGRASLIDVQWTYLAIALFCVILALFFYYMPLPEASDEDLQLQTMQETPFSFSPQNTNGSPAEGARSAKGRFGSVRFIYITLAMGVASQYFYVAAQECVSLYFGPLLTPSGTNTADYNVNISDSPPALSVLDSVLVAHASFALARLVTAALCLVIKPRIVLLVVYVGNALFASLAFGLSDVSGNALTSIVALLFFFEGPLFPLIFAITLRGMGRRTKDAAAYLTSAVNGGAAFPWIMYAITHSAGKGVQFAYCLVIALVGLGAIFALYLNLNARAREQVDPKKKATWETRRNSGHSDGENERSHSATPIRRLSQGLSVMFQKIKSPGGDRGSIGSERAEVEHMEQSNEEEERGSSSRGTDISAMTETKQF